MTGSSCELGCKLDFCQPGSRNCPKMAQVLGDVGRSCLAHAAEDALPVGYSEADSDTPALFSLVTSPQSICSEWLFFPKYLVPN